jgi:hypothetical protein
MIKDVITRDIMESLAAGCLVCPLSRAPPRLTKRGVEPLCMSGIRRGHPSFIDRQNGSYPAGLLLERNPDKVANGLLRGTAT